jgi:hypothetical protein
MIITIGDTYTNSTVGTHDIPTLTPYKNIYVAYADSDTGTGFLYPETNDQFDASKTYYALLVTNEVLDPPTAGDFTGLWTFRGGAGIGITDISLVGSVGLVDTYRITYTDSSTQDYTVTNGADGDTGPQGIQGIQGATGATGAQGPSGTEITSFSRTSGDGSPGSTDTYTVEYNDQPDTVFQVYNGTNGIDGQDVDHVSLTSGTGAAGTTDTYTVWGDVGETINLGSFDVTNGANGVAGGTLCAIGNFGAIIQDTEFEGVVGREAREFDLTISTSSGQYFLFQRGVAADDWAVIGNLKGATGADGASAIEGTHTEAAYSDGNIPTLINNIYRRDTIGTATQTINLFDISTTDYYSGIIEVTASFNLDTSSGYIVPNLGDNSITGRIKKEFIFHVSNGGSVFPTITLIDSDYKGTNGATSAGLGTGNVTAAFASPPTGTVATLSVTGVSGINLQWLVSYTIRTTKYTA